MEYASKKKQTRRDRFLAEIGAVTPWASLTMSLLHTIHPVAMAWLPVCRHAVKNLFMHRKARYKGMAKNTAQLFSLFGFANLLLARWWIDDTDRQVAS